MGKMFEALEKARQERNELMILPQLDIVSFSEQSSASHAELDAEKEMDPLFRNIEKQRSLLLRQRSDLDASLTNTRNQVDELEKKLSYLRSQKEARQELETGDSVKTGDPAFQEMEKELFKAQAEWSSQTAKVAALKEQLASVEGEIRSFNLLENEYQNLKRDVGAQKNYRIRLESISEEARVPDEMNRQKTANISGIHAATPPAEKIKPKKRWNILLNTLTGIIQGLGFAMFPKTSQSFSNPESA